MKRLVRAVCTTVIAAFLAFTSTVFGAEKITYYHFDALGSPVAATDEQGNVVWRETYRPYGERIQNQSAAASLAEGLDETLTLHKLGLDSTRKVRVRDADGRRHRRKAPDGRRRGEQGPEAARARSDNHHGFDDRDLRAHEITGGITGGYPNRDWLKGARLMIGRASFSSAGNSTVMPAPRRRVTSTSPSPVAA